MQLHGRISPDQPLLVVALELEAVGLRGLGLPILVTGAGKVNAAVAVATIVAANRPRALINLGTAGGLKDHIDGTHMVSTVLEHDVDDAAIHALADVHTSLPINLAREGMILATGDRFIADPAHRALLAVVADMVDMEGYAIAKAAAAAGIELTMVKQVSDRADESASTSWVEAVTNCSYQLAMWVREHV
ncbi:MAG: nucleosidase [Candidatus Nanopelagicales bacterium]